MKVRNATFRGRARWLEIGIAVSDRSLTMAECARKLGVNAGALHRPIKEMIEAEVLEVDGSTSFGRNARYRLPADLREPLEAEVAEGQPLGRLLEGQPLFLVEIDRLLDLAQALVESDLTRSVVWLAELDGGTRYLLVLDSRPELHVAHARLRTAIEATGGSCLPLRTSRIMTPPAWRALLASVRDASG